MNSMWYAENGDWGLSCPKCGFSNRYDEKTQKLVCQNKKCGFSADVEDQDQFTLELAQIGAKWAVNMKNKI